MAGRRAQERLRQFRRSEPGSRFQERYHRSQPGGRSRWNPSRLIALVAGIAIVLVGLFAVAFPTPAGWVLVLVGLAVVAGEIEPVARFMDRVEVRVRGAARRVASFWSKSSTAARVLVVAAVMVAVAVLGYGAYMLLFGG